MLRQTARAKINLYLHVGARRADGFRELESLAVFADVGDAMTFEAADELSLAVDGPFCQALDPSRVMPAKAGIQSSGSLDFRLRGNDNSLQQNLVLRAARALAEANDVLPKAHITLTKNLPVASGIGGGSADAAATLRGLNALWGLGASVETLQQIGLVLGSDVPVCVASRPAYMAGRGERLTLASDIPDLPIVLVNPGVSVSTSEVFARLRAPLTPTLSPDGGEGELQGISLSPIGGRDATAERGRVRGATRNELVKALSETRNDLETPAREIAPDIDNVLASLRDSGALLARMSGSGATCFGIFHSNADAGKTARCIARANPDWWCVASRTGGS